MILLHELVPVDQHLALLGGGSAAVLHEAVKGCPLALLVVTFLEQALLWWMFRGYAVRAAKSKVASRLAFAALPLLRAGGRSRYATSLVVMAYLELSMDPDVLVSIANPTLAMLQC